MITVRERPPLRLHIEAETPTGRHYRWATDEPLPENVPTGLRFSSTMPGGFENLDVTLPRKAARDYVDLEELTTLRVRGAGGGIRGEYRLQAAPRTSGDQMAVTPQALGWQAHLDDDQSAAAIYVDRDLSRWVGAGATYRLNSAAAYIVRDPSTLPDATSGIPVLRLSTDGAPWALGGLPLVIAMYDAGAGCVIGSIYHSWRKGGNVSAADTNWHWRVDLSTDDTDGIRDNTGELRGAGPGTGTLAATTSTRRFAWLNLWYDAASASNSEYLIDWPCVAVYGDHGLTKRGTASATDAQGLYASDVVAHAVARWAPKLAFTTGVGGTIQPSSFVIPHLAFLDPTTASEIVKQASRFDLPDWAVWEGPTFYWNARGARGKTWRARVGPAQLQETGPSIDRLWNSVVVRYTDVTGTTRTVGPPGSGADATDSQLVDTDPQNPANQAGVTRRALLAMGTSTAAGAIQVGAKFLAFQKIISSAGQARLVGYVEDDRGVLWPASYVRSGDSIVFVDAADPTTERRIVRANYTDADKACEVDLDAPPDAMEALLERLSVVLVPLGVN